MCWDRGSLQRDLREKSKTLLSYGASQPSPGSLTTNFLMSLRLWYLLKQKAQQPKVGHPTWLCSHSALGAEDSGDKLIWRKGTLQGKPRPSTVSKVALAALQIQRAAGAPSLVIHQPSAVLLLLITALESLHRSSQLLPYK